MIYIIWLTLFTLFVFSFLSDNKVPLWIPVICYMTVVIFRVKEKIGNYKDSLEVNRRDEELKLEEVAENMADKGLTFSGARMKEENNVKQDFNYQRKKKKRAFENELINSLFLK